MSLFFATHLYSPFDRYSIVGLMCFHSYIVVPDPSLVIQDRAKMHLSKLHIALISGIIFGVLLFCTFIALIVRKLCIPKVSHRHSTQNLMGTMILYGSVHTAPISTDPHWVLFPLNGFVVSLSVC